MVVGGIHNRHGTDRHRREPGITSINGQDIKGRLIADNNEVSQDRTSIQYMVYIKLYAAVSISLDIYGMQVDLYSETYGQE
jgi:hypothetical protein